MAKDYTQLCQDILENVGGKENINGLTHCITRLRFKLKDDTKANTEVIEKLPGVIKVMNANGQYHVVVGNKVEDVYEQFIKVSGVAAGGAVEVEEAEGPKTPAAIAIDLISGIFAPILGPFSAAGIMKGILACITQFYPEFATDGAYTVLYTIADGLFYFLPVMLAITAARKFKMNEFTALGIGVALVYPTMVALTGGDVLGSVDLGFFGTFSWYATFLGIPILMPASGYTSSVIPVLLMVWFGSVVEHWTKKWMPNSVKMFFTPLLVMTLSVVLGYLIIGPVATLITNILSSIFQLIFGLPVVGSIVGSVVVGAFWMCLVIFGFHWSLVPIGIVNLTTLGHDFILASMIGHSFALGAALFAMFLKNKDAQFREICLPAMISAFFFGVTEPAIYGIALPQKKPFVIACIGSAVGGLIIGITGATVFISGGLGIFNLLSFLPTDPASTVGFSMMISAIIACVASAVVAFAIEFMTYKPEQA